MGLTSILIIEELGNDKYVLKCACCNGSGEMSRDHDGRSPYEICSVCRGRGVVLVEVNGNLPFVKCACCNGSGEMSRDHDGRGPYTICEVCHGVGAVPITGTMRLIK